MAMSKAAKQRKKRERETGWDVTIKRGSWNGVDPRNRIKENKKSIYNRKKPLSDYDYPDNGLNII